MKKFLKILVFIAFFFFVLLSIGFLIGKSIICIYRYSQTSIVPSKYCPYCNSEMSYYNEFEISKSSLKFICAKCGIILNDTDISYR